MSVEFGFIIGTMSFLVIGTFVFVPIMAYVDSKVFGSGSLSKKAYSFEFKIPTEFILSIKQYLMFFTEYVKVTKGKSIIIEMTEFDSKLKVRIKGNSEISKEDLDCWIQEYLNYFKNSLRSDYNMVINVSQNVEVQDIDLLKLKLQNQIESLKKSLELSNIRIKELIKDKDFLKELAIKHSSSSNNIKNQIIHGGSQQFGGTIYTK